MISSIKKLSYQHLYMTTCICPIIFFFCLGSDQFSCPHYIHLEENFHFWSKCHLKSDLSLIMSTRGYFLISKWSEITSKSLNLGLVKYISFGVSSEWKFLKGWWMGGTRWLKEGIVDLTDKNASCFTAGWSGSLSVKSNLLLEMCENTNSSICFNL